MSNLLVHLARAPDEAGIPYMVIGGQAVLIYGEPRLTRDIDVTLGLFRMMDVVQARNLRILGENPEDVMIHKMLAERPRDVEDVHSILRKQKVDRDSIRRWLEAFGQTPGQPFVQRFEQVVHEEEVDNGA